MTLNRRDLVSWASAGLAAVALPTHGMANRGMTTDARKAVAEVAAGEENTFNIRRFGAVGDGKAIDSKAINAAIDAASAAGGGTVFFPAGTYASYSIRLKSHITLYLDQGAVILAAANSP